MDERTEMAIKIANVMESKSLFGGAKKEECAFEIVDILIAEGFSRRPELDEEELIPFLLTLRTFYNKDGDVDLTAIAKSICANFTAPEAKPSSPVNAELRSALEECIRVMLENDEYGWSDDAIKQAEQALNSIKAGEKVNVDTYLPQNTTERCVFNYGVELSRNETIDDVESLNQPLVRGMEIDVEALAEVIFKSQMKIAGLMNTWNQATPALKSIYIDQAKYYVANAHVWLKEVEKGK